VLTLDDRTGRIEALLFEETFQQHRELVVKDALVLVEGQLRFDEFSDGWRLAARRISALDAVREREARRLVLRVARDAAPGWCEQLAAALTPWRGGTVPVTIEYAGTQACGALTLGAEWTVRASGELLEQLDGLLGRDAVQVFYGAPPASPGSSFADGG
jgi:DNA polymerase-3 subunit alpha